MRRVAKKRCKKKRVKKSGHYYSLFIDSMKRVIKAFVSKIRNCELPRNYCILRENKNSLKSLANAHATHNFICFNIPLAFCDRAAKIAKIHRARNFLFHINAHISKVFYYVSLCYTQNRANSDNHTMRRGKFANCCAKTKCYWNEVSKSVM